MLRNHYKRFLSLFLGLLLAVTALAGCAEDKRPIVEVSEADEGDKKTADSEFMIYYKTSDGVSIKPMAYTAGTGNDDIIGLVKELFEQLSTPIPDDPTVVPAVEKGREITSLVVLNDGTLKIDFLGAPKETNPTDIVLARAAFVLTMTQIEGIDYVDMSYDNVPVNVGGSASASNKMAAEDFILEADQEDYSLRKRNVTVFFADREGKRLYETEKTVLYNGNVLPERMVMQMLIEGPADDRYQAVLPSDLTIIDVSVKSNVCYVNFDNTFLTNTIDLPADLIIYSIVNSLTALPTVGQVQILVDGSSDYVFRDLISLNHAFTTNLNFIK